MMASEKILIGTKIKGQERKKSQHFICSCHEWYCL